ncbi:MAG: hypothetical protein QOD69_2517 [Solirubrobacteraceae bacterium]|nr:hypothetical protein [Solirubrobacteraceae bacterium]
MKVLFFLRSINYDRHFEAVLRELSARGHHVHVAFDIEKKGRAGDSALLDAIRAEHGRLSYGLVPPAADPAVADLQRELRLGTDYLRYLGPEFAQARALRERARQRASSVLTAAAALPGLRTPRGRRALDRTLRTLEAALPPQATVVELIKRHDPDVVLVSPLVGLGSPQGDYMRAAASLGIPTVLLVASWDNLTNKGVIRDQPDLTLVWNPAQIREAVELHGLPREAVVATGAHTYDQWFAWQPSTERKAFCASVGLDAERPFILYVCSSGFIAPEEASFVQEWVRRLRDSDDPKLRDVGVLIRPHPANARMWQHVDVAVPGLTAIYPREGAAPTNARRKADYFDSIHHCAAVMGINTSAQIESAVVGRPVFTLLDAEFRDTQAGTLHFSHIASPDGDTLLTVGRTWEEHHAQLSRALDPEEADAERLSRFVRSFVRPHGLERAATPMAADAIEQAAACAVSPRTRSAGQSALTTLVGVPLARVLPHLRRAGSVVSALQRPAPRRPRRAPEGRLRILFVLEHPGILMHFDRTVEELAARGHRVQLAFGRPTKFPVALEALDTSSGRIVVHERAIPQRADAYAGLARRVRAMLDLLHYLTAEMAGASYARAKWTTNRDLPLALRVIGPRLRLGPRSNAVARRLLRAIERAIPSDAKVQRFVEKAAPDVVLVSPLINQRAYQTDYLKSAQALGIPAGLCVASWDNLSSKGLIRTPPDLVTVWNRTQADEAVTLHDVPRERVVITGAQPFDRWHDRTPSTSGEELRDALGLPANRPYVLFVGSTKQQRAPQEEIASVRTWVTALRGSDDPELAGVAVLVRPHPTLMAPWAEADLGDLGDVVVWRRDTPLPVKTGDRAAYYDALHHAAAVVGMNSSAMIEAAIIGRPVHTAPLPEWRALQDPYLHFRYLRVAHGGFLREAPTLEEHLRLLAADLRDPAEAQALNRRFVEHFIRPHGTDRPALDHLVATIEAFGRAPSRPPARPSPGAIVLRLAAPLLTRAPALHAPRRVTRRLDRARRRGAGGAKVKTKANKKPPRAPARTG